jgi:AbrB family looped-hinge helix DNA binding protein
MTERVIISSSGAITIPASFREACGLKADEELILETVEQGLLLRPSLSLPIEDYTEERIAEFAADEKAIGSLIPQNKI